MTPRMGASGASGSTPRAPGLDRPRQQREYDKKTPPDWSNRGGMKHGASTRTGSFGAEPGATDWSVPGSGENMTKRPPGLEQPGRNEARRKPPDWIVRG